MIATGDIKNIVMEDISRHPILGAINVINKDVALGVTQHDNFEQIVISAGEAVNEPLQQTECIVDIMVPDVRYENNGMYHTLPDYERLNELENECIDLFTDEAYGVFRGRNYTYKLRKIKQEGDPTSWRQILCISLIFEVINI